MTRATKLLILASVLAGALVFAPAAGANVACNFTTDQVNVQVNEPGDVAKLEIGGGGTILVDSATGPVICGPAGPPTVTNTDRVAIADTSDNPATPAPTDGSTRVEITEPSAFVPGATLTGENGGLGEIEFALYLNDGSDDTIRVLGASPGADVWVMGAAGLNWNAGANDSAADPDLTSPSDLDHWSFLPGGGDDRVSGQGGSGTGVPFPGRIEFAGDVGNDMIEGGEATVGISGDQLDGGAGDDVVRGFGGDDLLYAADGGDDSLDGGPGEDDLTYYGLPAGVRADLSLTGPQDTGAAGIDTITGIENLNGTEHADTLTGNGGFNYLYGNQGDDTLDGGPGDDAFTGGAGSDTASYERAPNGVTVDLNASTGLGHGNDGIAEVENLIGSPFADSLTGSDDANSITGLAGEDAVSALAGADTVHVRDYERDTVSCGSEVDTVTADRIGFDLISADCETVERGDALHFELTGKRKQRVLKRKGVVVQASCPLEDCIATATAKGRLPKSRRAVPGHVVRAKPVTEPLAAGVTERLNLTLRRRQLKQLEAALTAGKKPTLKVRAQATDAVGNAVTDTAVVRAKR